MVHFLFVMEALARLQPQGRLARHVPAVAIFVIVAIALTWPLARQLNDTLISWGDPVFQAWTIAWNWHALTTAPLGVFDANVFYPWRNTLAYSDHLFGQTLLVLPVIALTGNGILADNVALLLAFTLSACAMYLLVYDMTGNRAAGILAGLAYAFAPSRMAHVEHLHLLSAQWMPLALLGLRRVMRQETLTMNPLPAPALSLPAWLQPSFERARSVSGKRWYALLAAAFLMQGLSGVYFFYFTIVMLLIVGAVYLALAISDYDWGAVRRLLLAAGVCAVAGLLLIPTLLPYLRVHDDLGIERTTEEVTVWSANTRDYLAVWPRNRLYNGALERNFRHIEQALFPGLFVLLLAAVGLANRRAGRDRWVLLAVALGAGILSLGLSKEFAGHVWTLPYQVFYDHLPGFRAIRVPARLGLLALVGLAGLAGLGVDYLWRLAREKLRFFTRYPDRLYREPMLLGLLLFGLSLGWVGVEAVNRLEIPDPLPPASERADYQWIADNPAPTLELPMGEGPVASAWPNFWSMWHWNEVANGYSGIVPPTYYPFRERMQDFPSDATLRLLQGIGVENIILHGDFPDDSRAEVEAAIAQRPELTLRLAGFDAVYTLERDPWMWELAELIPDGEVVDLPNATADPVAFGLLMAILQRTGHTVEGNGQIDYYTLTPAAEPRCWLVLFPNDPPAVYGYTEVTVVRAAGGMTLYRDDACE
ncbi:MAG TPA: hypothetical protein VMM78_09950 [Thermomicrobiales bacterium]|nr:hypothetical protein [Thermomicrobiales bacterium]